MRAQKKCNFKEIDTRVTSKRAPNLLACGLLLGAILGGLLGSCLLLKHGLRDRGGGGHGNGFCGRQGILLVGMQKRYL
jgi:hypothetical protein